MACEHRDDRPADVVGDPEFVGFYDETIRDPIHDFETRSVFDVDQIADVEAVESEEWS